MNNNYYLDMDGVLAIYEQDAYTGEEPKWLKKNLHYFRSLKPDMKALKIADALWRWCQQHTDNLYVLSSLIPNGAIFNEHLHDKILWLRDWMPYLKIENILISVTSKRDAVEYIMGHSLTERDILIDDYNKNLIEWEKAGGRAIKYCNGINSTNSFNGTHIYPNDSTQSAINYLLGIARRHEH